MTADVLRYVTLEQSDNSLLHDVVTMVAVDGTLVGTSVLLCRGLYTVAPPDTLNGISVKVAEGGATGPVKMAEPTMLAVGAGANCEAPCT